MPSMVVNCEIHEAKNSAKSESFALKKRNKCFTVLIAVDLCKPQALMQQAHTNWILIVDAESCSYPIQL